MAARIHHIGIAVPNLQEAAKFFYEVFGVGSQHVAAEQLKNLYIQFENLSLQIVEDPARLAGAKFGRMDHIAIHVDDLDDTTKRLKEHGVDVVWNPPVKLEQWRNNFTTEEGGVGVQFQLADQLAHERGGQEFRPELMDVVAPKK